MVNAPGVNKTERRVLARRAQAGIAMVTVLFVTTAIVLLAVTFSLVAMSERRSTASSVETELALQLADAGTERARREIVAAFNNTFLSIGNFLREVGNERLPALSGVRTLEIDGTQIHWRVIDVSTPDAPYGWIDVAATADLGGDAVQTVVRRVGFGASSTFGLAMLSETTNCMFCHLRVNGDVGNLVFMRPGWGEEGGSGKGSGGNLSGVGGSVIEGNVFAAQDVTRDNLEGGTALNGARVTGVIERYSTNAGLPTDLDGDGIADFPPIRRDVAIANAVGSIGGGVRSCTVAIGGTFNGNCGSANYSGTINGNLILEGTRANPIVIDGDVWVEGDVIIKGYVSGLGGLYAGRNVYLAGDVRSLNPAYHVDENNRCVDENGVVIMTQAAMTATGFSPDDACARRSIADDTDALRIAARGSIIIGDYTEYDENGDLKSYDARQSSEFYRQQFGFAGNSTRWYDRATGDELRCSGNTCINADGQAITNRIQVNGYNASFRPGTVNSGGFSQWMTDAQYAEILGTEEFSHNTWRWEFTGSDFSQGPRLASVFLNLIDAGLPLQSALEVIDRKVDFRNMNQGQFNQMINAVRAAGYPVPTGITPSQLETLEESSSEIRTVDDNGEEVYFKWSGNTLRVIYAGEREYETQVNRIDAFLYANQRNAGKTSMQAMSINGGLVAKDLGILAPGRSLEAFRSRYPAINNSRATACSNPNSDSYVFRSEDCALTVNYDHRLRNGGYGYNIIEGRIGITLDWRPADSKDERVHP